MTFHLVGLLPVDGLFLLHLLDEQHRDVLSVDGPCERLVLENLAQCLADVLSHDGSLDGERLHVVVGEQNLIARCLLQLFQCISQ